MFLLRAGVSFSSLPRREDRKQTLPSLLGYNRHPSWTDHPCLWPPGPDAGPHLTSSHLVHTWGHIDARKSVSLHFVKCSFLSWLNNLNLQHVILFSSIYYNLLVFSYNIYCTFTRPKWDGNIFDYSKLIKKIHCNVLLFVLRTCILTEPSPICSHIQVNSPFLCSPVENHLITPWHHDSNGCCWTQLSLLCFLPILIKKSHKMSFIRCLSGVDDHQVFNTTSLKCFSVSTAHSVKCIQKTKTAMTI